MNRQFEPSQFFLLEQFAHKALFEDCTHVWDALEKISSYLEGLSLGKMETEVSASAYLINPSLISIGPGTVVEPGAYIQGPCVIGSNCQIRNGAYIRGDVVVGDACVVGHGTEVKNSILLDRANASHFNYVGDSILGNGVNLGAGVKCANLKLNHALVCFLWEGKKIETGLKKLGSIIGDGAQLGCNSVCNPGTLIGKKSIIYPCVNVGGFIAEESRIKRSK
ncbi:MAG: UDP-N-acetylglucosamine diphosphorylase [Chlamydiales bacterium]|nr:UDP-N-acetylglucosamine diphosphorylase [Chlamydiales bacterium]